MEKKYHILLIEDDAFLAEIYMTKFEQSGFFVSVARDGEEGLRMAANLKPNLVALDVVLPKVDGFTVLECLRGNPDLQQIPVVLLTNLGQKEDVDRGVALGATAYFVKAHFTPSEIAEKIKEILNKD